MSEAEVLEVLVKGLDGMSAYEAIDLQFQRFGMAAHIEEMVLLQSTIFITLLSAYLAAAYVGGANLNRAQVLIGSFIFVFSSVFMAFNVWISWISYQAQVKFIGMQYLAMAEVFERPDWVGFGESLMSSRQSEFMEWIMVGLMVTGVIGSLYFMWNQRHPNTD